MKKRTNIPSLTNRQKIILFLVQAFSKDIERPTAALFHEYVYLLLREEDFVRNPFKLFNFKSYVKGIFSEPLRDDLEKLFNANMICYKDGKFQLTSLGKSIAEKLGNDPYILNSVLNQTHFAESRKKYNSAHSIYLGANGYSVNNKIGETLHSSH